MRNQVLLLAALLIGHLAHAEDAREYMEKFGVDPNASFSGTRHVESKEGQMDMFIRQAPQKMRMDMEMAGRTMTVITREDLGVNYMLMPQMNMYKEVKADEMMAGGASLSFSEVSEVGRESVSGYACTKFKAKFADARGGRAGGYYWVSDDGILMKVDMIYKSRKQKGQRMVFTMRDLQIGAQDPTYFEVPDNYSKMGFGMGMGQLSGARSGPATDQGAQTAGYEEPTLGDAMQEVAEDEAEKAVVDETRKSVRKSLKKLFGK